MTYQQAKETLAAVEAYRAEHGGLRKVEIDHRGFWSRHTPELDADGLWSVYLVATRDATGSHAGEWIREVTTDHAVIGRVVERLQAELRRQAARTQSLIAAEREAGR